MTSSFDDMTSSSDDASSTSSLDETNSDCSDDSSRNDEKMMMNRKNYDEDEQDLLVFRQSANFMLKLSEIVYNHALQLSLQQNIRKHDQQVNYSWHGLLHLFVVSSSFCVLFFLCLPFAPGFCCDFFLFSNLLNHLLIEDPTIESNIFRSWILWTSLFYLFGDSPFIWLISIRIMQISLKCVFIFWFVQQEAKSLKTADGNLRVVETGPKMVEAGPKMVEVGPKSMSQSETSILTEVCFLFLIITKQFKYSS